jgi:aspartyl-tRNA(Asn)/glutamyl-tRNA(Gln) amidotransferase subunit A
MKTGDPRFIVPFTALGGPIVSMPIACDGAGLPLGLMLMSAPGLDARILEISERLVATIEMPR